MITRVLRTESHSWFKKALWNSAAELSGPACIPPYFLTKCQPTCNRGRSVPGHLWADKHLGGLARGGLRESDCILANLNEIECVLYTECEHRLRRQVGAPLWFSPTLPLNVCYLPSMITMYSNLTY